MSGMKSVEDAEILKGKQSPRGVKSANLKERFTMEMNDPGRN